MSITAKLRVGDTVRWISKWGSKHADPARKPIGKVVKVTDYKVFIDYDDSPGDLVDHSRGDTSYDRSIELVSRKQTIVIVRKKHG